MSTSDHLLQRLLALHPKRIDLTLDRIYTLLEKLGNPHQKLPPVVHIAGTNGKGSTHAFCASIAEAAGLLVHRYSSPHLVRFHERIILGGAWITEDDLSALLQECEEVQGGEPITFFEITTAAAFLAFSRTPADLLLLETGLGGRLDATNVIENPFCVQLSRIGIDHQEFLGNTLSDIAREKVEIARAGAPLVVGAQPEETLAVILRHAEDNGIDCRILGKDYDYEVFSDEQWQWTDPQNTLNFLKPSLRGKHQYENAALAVATMTALKDHFTITPEHIAWGLQNTQWAGRMQQVTQGKFVDLLPDGASLWVDGGHNLDAGHVLADCLADLSAPRLIVGMLENKDCAGYLACVSDYLEGAQSINIPDSEAALLAGQIATLHPKVSAAENFYQAVDKAIKSGGKNIVICGSLYLIGAFFAENDKKQ